VKRRIYDEEGREGVQQHEQRGGDDYDDPFADYFGGKEAKPNLFDETDVTIMTIKTFTRFYRR
jgi:hypothetical protein